MPPRKSSARSMVFCTNPAAWVLHEPTPPFWKKWQTHAVSFARWGDGSWCPNLTTKLKNKFFATCRRGPYMEYMVYISCLYHAYIMHIMYISCTIEQYQRHIVMATWILKSWQQIHSESGISNWLEAWSLATLAPTSKYLSTRHNFTFAKLVGFADPPNASNEWWSTPNDLCQYFSKRIF